jgi:hypothetical protein
LPTERANGRLTLEETPTRSFIAFDKADFDKDDLLGYLEIETCWRGPPGPLSQHGRTAF